MLTRERIKEILSRSAWCTTRAETAELLRLALVGFDMENAARKHQGHPSFMEETMTETTEPTREQLIEMIDGMVNRTDDPQWMRDKEDNGTQIEWFVAALRLALRTLDAEAQLAERDRYIAEQRAITEPSVQDLARQLREATEQAENLLWNLAGCDTIASSGTPTTFDASMARPALHAVNRMATRLVDARAQLAAMTERAEKAERRQADAEAAELRRANEKMDAIARAEELSRRNIELARALPDERVRGACQVIRAMLIPLDALLPAEREALKVFAAWLDSLDTVR